MRTSHKNQTTASAVLCCSARRAEHGLSGGAARGTLERHSTATRLTRSRIKPSSQPSVKLVCILFFAAGGLISVRGEETLAQLNLTTNAKLSGSVMRAASADMPTPGDRASGSFMSRSILSQVTDAFLAVTSLPQTNRVPGQQLPRRDQRTTNALPATTDTRTPALDDKHKLAPGDRVSFRIAEDQEEPRSILVTESGEIEVPYLGLVAAADRTCREMARELKDRLERDYYYQATVTVALEQSAAKGRGKIYLMGYVRTPGSQEIPSDEVFTLSKAIMRAGGFGEFADKKHVRVNRRGLTGDSNQVLELNVAAVIEDGRAEKDVVLEAGDLIYVPGRLFKF
jgi:protein involved in polysaccharide export with SLBB domain